MKALKIMTIEKQFMAAYDEYATPILRFAHGRVGSAEVAQDITSEVFFKAWDYVRQGKNIKNMKSFFYKIASNLIIDYYRKKYRTDLPIEAAENKISEIQGLPEMQISAEAKIVREELKKLPKDYGAVLSYRYVDDLDMKEIAEITGKSLANVYVTIYRALKLIKKRFEEKEK
jgi:RNA polymerase sigma-70 factor (ECF subfamily)